VWLSIARFGLSHSEQHHCGYASDSNTSRVEYLHCVVVRYRYGSQNSILEVGDASRLAVKTGSLDAYQATFTSVNRMSATLGLPFILVNRPRIDISGH
jgi:hypothetical protein